MVWEENWLHGESHYLGGSEEAIKHKSKCGEIHMILFHYSIGLDIVGRVGTQYSLGRADKM